MSICDLSNRSDHAVRKCPDILLGRTHLRAESLRGVQGEVGVAQEFAGEKDDVGLTVANDGLGLIWCRDQSDGAGENAGLFADLLRERNLVAGSERNLGLDGVAAGGGVNQVDS